jgi:hypothetical protein
MRLMFADPIFSPLFRFHSTTPRPKGLLHKGLLQNSRPLIGDHFDAQMQELWEERSREMHELRQRSCLAAAAG